MPKQSTIHSNSNSHSSSHQHHHHQPKASTSASQAPQKSHQQQQQQPSSSLSSTNSPPKRQLRSPRSKAASSSSSSTTIIIDEDAEVEKVLPPPPPPPPPPPTKEKKKERFDGDPRYHLNSSKKESNGGQMTKRNTRGSMAAAAAGGAGLREEEKANDEDDGEEADEDVIVVEEEEKKKKKKINETEEEDGQDGKVEDLCLVCEELACHCGGANGENVKVAYEKSPELGEGEKFKTTKLRFTMPSAPTADTLSTNKNKKTSSATTTADVAHSPPKRGRPRKDRVEVAAPAPAARPSPVPTQPHSRNNSQSGSGSGTSTPSRMSLRQVLAQSAKEAEEYFSSHSRESDSAGAVKETREAKETRKKDKKSRVKERERERKRQKERNVSDVSEFELDLEEDLDLDVDGEIEREEEDAMREEYEFRTESSSLSDLESEGGATTTTTTSTDDEGVAGSAADRLRRRKRDDSLVDGDDLDVDLFDLDQDEEDDDEENGDLTITDLPLVGTHGVVTWSDYDNSVLSSSDSDTINDADMDEDDDDEDDNAQTARSQKRAVREFENELEALLKLSEAVHGPVGAHEYELGEMWFEEVSDSDEEDDSDSRDGDDESDGEENDEEMGSDVEDGRKLLVDGWGMSTDDDESDSDLFYEGPLQGIDGEGADDGGDTTDSLDSDDHAGLVRFGIECDTSSSDTSTSSHHQHHPHLPFGTASLADVQAPTSADLASLPQYLFVNRRVSLQDINDDPDRTAMEVANGAIGTGSSPSKKRGAAGSSESDEILNSLLRSSTASGGGRRRRFPDIIEEEAEDEEAGETGRKRSSRKVVKKRKVAVVSVSGPAMGVWAPKEKARAVVIDESDTLAPSPFAKRKRRGRQLLNGTPARRLRADSKVSTTSGPSVTDGSISGEPVEFASPFLAEVDEPLDFDLNDLLHASLLHSGASSPNSSGASDREEQIAIGLADLSRWNRIPIGAFRSSTITSSPQSSFHLVAPTDRLGVVQQHHLQHHHRGDKHGAALSHTLSSPHGSSVHLTKRAIERRMLTSPVFGPVATPSGMDSPKSHRVRRKERKIEAATIEDGKLSAAAKSRKRAGSIASVATTATSASARGGKPGVSSPTSLATIPAPIDSPRSRTSRSHSRRS